MNLNLRKRPKMPFLRVFLTICLFLSFGIYANAQGQITGRILDKKGTPIPGASIVEKGSRTVAITNDDGSYSISVTTPNPILEFHSVGSISQTITVGGRTTMNVTLEDDAVGLEEVVVVAYGTQRKSSVTGSITTVKGDDLKAITSPNVSGMLSGKVSGVSVTSTSGRPGENAEIRIRGRGSVGTTEAPLWVVDGVIDGMTSQLNPNDIESITVLKDASAAALYGSRASNGVIVVTTKTGRRGSDGSDKAVTASVKLGLTTLSRGKYKMMNSSELYDYFETAYANAGKDHEDWFNPSLKDNNTDWLDFVTQTALTQNYNISLNVANNKVRAYVSGDYYTEEGTVKGYDYQRFTLRSNVDYIYNEKLTIKTKISGNYWKDDNQQYSIGASNLYLPWDTPYDSHGKVKTGLEGRTNPDHRDNWYGRDQSNFLYDNQLNWAKGEQFGVDGMIGFEYKILDYLVFESTNNFGYKYTLTESYSDPRAISQQETKGQITNQANYQRKMYTNQLLRFSKKFNNLHEVSAFMGYEFNDFYTNYNKAGGTGIPIGGEIGLVATIPLPPESNKYMYKALAYYFNSNYTFDDRYMFQFSFRRDGSSRFGVDNRYGNFFSVGGGWNLKQENFMQSAKFLDALKLRVSYGLVGNTPGAAYTHMGLYKLSENYGGESAMFPFQMANRNLTWEKTYTTNIGIDARLFNRLNLTIDYYNKNTSDMLYSRPLSTVSGYASRYENIGSMKNTGIEINVGVDVIKTKDWNLYVDANVGYNKNKMTKLANDNSQQIKGKKVLDLGYDADTWFLKEWAGVDPDNGRPLWYAVDEKGVKSLTGNEVNATKTHLGTGVPKFTGGGSVSLTFKDFTLSANFLFASGHKIYNGARIYADDDGLEPFYNGMKLKDGWNRWEKPGDIATHPQLIYGGNNKSTAESSRYLERGDFFKMKALTLAYNIPATALKSLRLKGANVYVNAENIFTITQFSGVDPEVVTGASNSGSTSSSIYPVPRRFSFGLNVTF